MDGHECPFCDVSAGDIVLQNPLAYARWDKYPVSRGHLLVITFRHHSNYFDASDDEVIALWRLVKEAKQRLREQFSPDGYNIGVNVGRAAGQSVPHMHIHLIPRYAGDNPDPFGGVRGVVPEKRRY